MDNLWLLKRHEYDEEKRAGIEPVFTLGNGFIGCRGFFEEEQEGIFSLGGIYMAGVFGQADYKPWKGLGRELVNTPNCFYTDIKIDGEQVQIRADNTEDFKMILDMREGRLTRSYLWKGCGGSSARVDFERFISLPDIHLAGQKVKITPVGCSPDIKITFGINAEITNLNAVSCEPLPIQPGRRHMETVHQDASAMKAVISAPEEIFIAEGQSVRCVTPESMDALTQSENHKGRSFEFRGINGQTAEFDKLVHIYTSLDSGEDPLERVNRALAAGMEYASVYNAHKEAWRKKWKVADIEIEGSDDDQVTLRYNMFQLMQACPRHDPRLSIGARGLTGEMYEGCIFWDTEIFMLPFFTYTDPIAAQKLLEFRYHTLPEARAHAADNWFNGAMYGWQVSEKGIEQTPQGVGAYYSIHVIADIAYAILEYWYATHDISFMADKGVEILIETARFWESRVHKDPFSDSYNLLAVRGPNEYDVIVNNNLYTNMMAQQNFILVTGIIEVMKKEYRDKWQALAQKLNFQDAEIENWKVIIDKMVLPYCSEMDLYEEDDMYLRRVPLDMKKAKPTAKRIIDTTIPYEGLMLYQITKQADVLHLMKNLPWRFTGEQKMKAWEYYVPKTCNDSSLSYSMHSVMAARLGLSQEAYRFFDICANLDIRDVQLNTVSGLHFANFGGVWQAAVLGFAGVSLDSSTLSIEPHLPAEWKKMNFHLYYKGNLLDIKVSTAGVHIKLEEMSEYPAEIRIFDERISLDKERIEYDCIFDGKHEAGNEKI